MNKKILLKAINVSKYYPGVVALKNFNFNLMAGEIHCIIGENGAGKSTFVKILSGAIGKSTGKIFLENREADIQTPRDAQNYGVGIIYQESKINLVPYFSIARNIFLGDEIINKLGIVNNKEMIRLSKDILHDLKIELNPLVEINRLSTTEKTLVQIAKAIRLHSKVLIIDEATSALPKKESDRLLKILIFLKNQGKGIIFISHNIEEVLKIGDRISILRDGNHIDTKTRKELDTASLIEMMVGRKILYDSMVIGKSGADNLLEVKNISLLKANIKDISFNLHSGEILGFAGIVGSGRTEVAQMLFGVNRANSGRIFLNKKEISLSSPWDAIKNGIAMIPEDRLNQGLLTEMNIMDNIILASMKKILKFGVKIKKKQVEISDKMINDLSIKTPSRNQLVKYLSGVNQQKVVIAKWIITNAKIFILDEPTRGIDVGGKKDIYDLIVDLAKKGKGIIFISSELPELLRLCDRILVFRKSQIVGEFSSDEVNQEKIIKLAAGGEFV